MMKKIMFLVLIFALAATPAFAANQCLEKCGSKLGTGLTNVLLGWSEIFTEPYEAAKNDENVLVGVGKGLWNAVGDTVGGALNTVTFFIHGYSVPLPEGGIQLS